MREWIARGTDGERKKEDRRRMKHEKLIPATLEILQRGAETSAALFDAFTSGYGTSYRKFSRLAQRGPRVFRTDWAELYREHQRFYSLLNRMKRQGLVVKEGSPRRAVWRITSRGRVRLSARKGKAPLPPPRAYQKGADTRWRVVVYDIPERERRKREWIRAVLLALGFSFLQESVWVGKRTLPESFLQDLRELELLGCVHIFEISRRGTITAVKSAPAP